MCSLSELADSKEDHINSLLLPLFLSHQFSKPCGEGRTVQVKICNTHCIIENVKMQKFKTADSEGSLYNLLG